MKRGNTDLSLILGVKKPKGCTSHDVVNACRRIFGERRIGHAGTLDPMAEGVMIVLVGPAARLNAYLENFDKTYTARISFGSATDTDDAEGSVIRTSSIPTDVLNETYATSVLNAFLGEQKQMPPAYSAIKQQGQKAYEAARKGKILTLVPRDINVYAADLLAIESTGSSVYWDVRFSVSKGTYIRALARDIGSKAGSAAHLSSLRRDSIGKVYLEDCPTLDELEQLATRAALDPVTVCGYRFAFITGQAEALLQNGSPLPAEYVSLCELQADSYLQNCACMSSVKESHQAPVHQELVLLLMHNCVKAVYSFDEIRECFVPACVFSKPIMRGVV